jgi:hypothetical protein
MILKNFSFLPRFFFASEAVKSIAGNFYFIQVINHQLLLTQLPEDMQDLYSPLLQRTKP